MAERKTDVVQPGAGHCLCFNYVLLRTPSEKDRPTLHYWDLHLGLENGASTSDGWISQ